VLSSEQRRIIAATSGGAAAIPSDIGDLIARSARFSLTDLGNSYRLRTYFGKDFCVRAEDERPGGTVLVWQTNHWSAPVGAAALDMCSESLGRLIRLEARTLRPSDRERAEIAAGDAAAGELEQLPKDAPGGEALKTLIAAGKRTAGLVANRVAEHLAWADTSEAAARMEAARVIALPRLRLRPNRFNHDTLMLPTRTHTLRFERVYDPECPDPDTKRVADIRMEVINGHRRDDFMTSVMEVDYRPGAKCPKFDAFMETYQPDPETRRCVMQFAGVCMTALLIQRFMLHWGRGANGKSVFLELLTRILGQFAVTLPNETISGPQRNPGQATPDIMQLFGRRMVRMVELESHQTVNVSMIKRLTGGEAVAGRPLFGGYVDFLPACKMQLTTNGEPTIEDVSNAIWRRLFLVEWPVRIPVAEQREFEDVVSELMGEADGILLRLIEGLKDYLLNGFVPSAAMEEQLDTYRGNMDWAETFMKECLEVRDGLRIAAAEMYAVYVEWAYIAGNTPITQTSFGRRMRDKFKREKSDVLYYVGVDRLPNAFPADAVRVDQYRRRKHPA
jgi:putative DNA primase/helicase